MSDTELNSNQEPEVQSENAAEVKPQQDEKKQCVCKKVRKIALWILGVIAAILVILLIFRDLYIPFAVSQAGTMALGTKVELKKFSSSLTGKVDIQGLTVANPEGYNNPHAFKLDRVYVDISIPSLFTDEIVVREILVTGMQVDLEPKLNRTNLGELKENVDELVGKGDKQQENVQAEENDDDDPQSQKSVVIEKLNINNNSISLSNATLGMTTKIPLIPISMTDIGKGQSIAETFNEIFIKILTSVFDAAAGIGGVLGDSFKSAGSAISDSAASVGKELTDVSKSIGNELSGAANKLFKGFKK